MTGGASRAAVILAAGLGKRMKSQRPKVLHEAAGRTLVDWVASAAREAGCGRMIAVIGPEFTDDDIARYLPDFETVVQKERLGTGHAVMQAARLLQEGVEEVLVLCGDVPCLSGRDLRDLVEARRRVDPPAACSVLTMVLADPSSYGRVVRDSSGRRVIDIVEFRDADEATRRVREVNSGTYAFSAEALLRTLPLLGNENVQGEYYLTDVVKMLAGENVIGVVSEDENAMLGVNTPEDLAMVEKILRDRIR